MRKFFALGVALLGLMGLSLVLARPAPPAVTRVIPLQGPNDESAPLHPDAVAVRFLLGVGDQQPQPWGGKVALDRGELLRLEAYRFRPADSVNGPDSWKAQSQLAKKAANKKQATKKTGPTASVVTPTGVIVQVKAPTNAVLTLSTEQGDAAVPLADLASGRPVRYLNGRVEAQLVPSHAPLVTTSGQEDFPAAAGDGGAGAWVAFVHHEARGPELSQQLRDVPENFQAYVPKEGGDQIKLVHFDGTSAPEAPMDVTPAGRDVWRPAVACRPGRDVVVVWSETIDNNWDLYSRTYDLKTKTWSVTKRLTNDPDADLEPALLLVGEKVHIAWQGWRNGQADVFLADLDNMGRARNVSDHPANDWSPAIAAGRDGRVFVAFDSYRNGSHDVFLAVPGTDKAKLVGVADSSKFEARPSIAVDATGRVWVAYEERTDNWGKDFGKGPNPGTPIYQASTVRVRCWDGEHMLDVADPLASASQPLRVMNSFPRLALDREDRPWLLIRHRQENNNQSSAVPVPGAVWYEYATALVGAEWSPLQPLPRSDHLLDDRPSLVVSPNGPLLVVYSSDGRLHREGSGQGGAQAKAKAAAADAPPRKWINSDLFVAALKVMANAEPARPGEAAGPSVKVPPVHANEAADVARMRAYRIQSGGRSYRLLRGEFHRHTDISPDGGGDGCLEDMWRYGLDASALDWMGCGDHDNGGGREYTWWLTQKTTDMHQHGSAFNPMFTYERSVNYPGGHRNVMFPTRGVRTLARLTGDNGLRIDVNGRDEDAQMLYKYLRELGGICAAHTSATDMGTDWRENDPKVEPFVEIYQGERDSYEHFGAPRVAHGPGDATGGWRPLGMFWNALALQYKIGFQSSSDHISTHMSMGVALAEAPTRAAIFDAFQRRHCYAATDNIILDVRSGDHLMGDEFTIDGPLTLSIRARGTGPIAKVDVIKDFHYVYSTEPGTDTVDFQWTDDSGVNRGPSWFYVRLIQKDGELAWASPMWVSKAR